MMAYSPRHEGGSRFADDNNKSKRVLAYVVIGVLLVTAVTALIIMLATGFGGSKQIVHTEGNRHDVTVAANGGPSGSELAGRWKLDSVTSYEFDGTGRGFIHTAKDFAFSYSADNGVLSIDVDTDDARDTEYQYTIDGLTLTLVRGANTYVFTKEI